MDPDAMREVIPVASPPQPKSNPLSADETLALRCVAGCMIPASAAYAVPGADDDAIFADILASLGRDAPLVSEALKVLEGLSEGRFAELEKEKRLSVAQVFREQQPALATVLARVTVQCYYRDDRVMRSLNMEVRPPYPLGFEVEQGDWSLLDAVRAGPKMYRDAT